MTSLLEKTISFIAPHRCIVCSNYNNIACSSCLGCMPKIEVSSCLLCGCCSTDWRICESCQPHTALGAAFAVFLYEDKVADWIKLYKFLHARAAYKELAGILSDMLPYFEENWLVTSIPTISAHIRQRGYDHGKLLATEFARVRNLKYRSLLMRNDALQQKGASREQRLKQMQDLLFIKQQEFVMGKKILVVDDVCTTGATLSAAAQALKMAGATEVSGAVVAWKK